MIEIKEVEKLAQLARLELKDEEKEKLRQDLDAILDYISELKEAPTTEKVAEVAYLQNVMREDTRPYPAGEFTDRLLAEAPNRAGDYIKVKKILG